MSFGQRLRELRNERGVNQTALAEKLGVSGQSYSAYENGREPPYSVLCAIAKYFGVTTDYLLELTDARKPDNINAAEKYGLSEVALNRLEEMHAYKSNEYLKRAVNTLLESGEALGAIARYLYWDLQKNEKFQGERLGSFRVVYKYGKEGDNVIFGTDEKLLGFYSMEEALTNDMYKRIVLVELQEQLMKLLEKEKQTEPFSDE